jgi:HK97 gp10 family phage protein
MAISAGVEVTGGAKAIAALAKVKRVIDQDPRTAVIFLNAAQIIADDAKGRAPVRPTVSVGIGGFTTTSFPGLLRSAIIARALPIRSGSEMGAIVKVNYSERSGAPIAPHAHLVEFGTKPHLIKSKNGKVLFFNGAYREEVHHPGAKPEPYFQPAVRAKTQDARVYILWNMSALIEQEATS